MTPKNTRLRPHRGFSLWEILAVLAIVALVAAILFPLFAKQRGSRISICSSNMKQIGLGLIGYTQDYDETFPPAVGAIRLSDGKLYEQQWGLTTKATIHNQETQILGIITPYLRRGDVIRNTGEPARSIYVCPDAKTKDSGLTYLYNDLAANESAAEMTAPANSILIADGDDHLRNVGHARSLQSEGTEAILRPEQLGKSPELLLGAAIGGAATRHQGGSYYGFLDGHVRWTKPDTIYYPPRTSSSSSHRDAKTGKILGPDPAGATGSDRTYQGKSYSATFHVR
jgi:prepilin-type N-terminal cleavage/methylation domain-containing protein/prepilin-type processing-associated H-X9-DG protein